MFLFGFLKRKLFDSLWCVLSLSIDIISLVSNCVFYYPVAVGLVSGKLSSNDNSNEKNPKKTKVVVLGGGFAGLYCCRSLSSNKSIEVVLVDPKKYFEYTPGILRAFVCPEKEMETLCQKLNFSKFRNVTHLQAKALKVNASKNEVDLELVNPCSKGTIPYDFLIAATGSAYSLCKPAPNSVNVILRSEEIKCLYDKICKSNKILVLGSGFVGVELVSEIVCRFPRKTVVLVDRVTEVCPTSPKHIRDYVKTWLQSCGVELELGVGIAGNYPNLEIDGNSCKLLDGRKLVADVVFNCTGFKPNSEMFCSEDNISVSKNRVGQLIVNDHLMVQSNIFAIGDVCCIPNKRLLSTAYTAEAQARVVSKNVLNFVEGKSVPIEKCPDIPKITILSLGRYNSVLEFNSFYLTGVLPSLLKLLIEKTKIEETSGVFIWSLFWNVADSIAFSFSKHIGIFKSAGSEK